MNAKAKKDWLKEIRTDVKARPPAMVAYGLPGIGKTSFGAAMPGCVFLIDDKEDGINTLKASGLVAANTPVLPPAKTWRCVTGMLEAMLDPDHPYRFLIVDTIGGLERLCHEHVCNEQFGGEWGDKGFASYQKGYEVSLPYWRELLNAFDKLRLERGMGVVCLAHSIVRPFKNPAGEDYDRYAPDMHHKTWSVTHKWADVVLFLNYYVETTKDKGRPKGRGGRTRYMHTEYEAAFEAKNRHNLPPMIDMGQSGGDAWSNLKQALIQSKGGA